MSLIKRIPITKVELGMYVSDSTPGLEDSELRPKGFIRRWETVDKLSKMGLTEIHIDVHRGLDSPFALPIAKADNLKPSVELEKEREQAQKVYTEARGLVGNILSNVKMGKAIDVGPVESLAEDINNSVLNNHNALLCLAAIREKDQYLLEHSINVGILMGVFTKYLGYEDELVHALVTGAILHDIGKIRVPNHVLNKPGKLTDEEWLEMKRHVVYGQEVLLKSEGITDVALAICGLHHERLDGGGYPMGVKEHEINNYGRLASIVDIYDALTADRVYHKGRSPAEAMQFLLELSDQQLDRELVTSFFRCMSVYPVGSLVELSNGRAGIVISVNSLKPESPMVKTIYNLRHQNYETPKTYNLAKDLNEIKVEGALNPETHGIKVADFI